MCEPTTIALAATAVAGGVSAYGQYQQGQANKQIAYNNARMAEYAAQDAQRRGEDAAIKAQQRARAVKGAQRASMAARGLDLNVGTAAELQDQTDFFGETDASTARFNARQEAWSARTQGRSERARGDFAAQQGTLGAIGTVLGSGGQVADQWYRYGR